jgi:hypothetical protein
MAALLLVLWLVADVAIESLDAGMVPLFAVASAGERLRKEGRGMVAREEVGLD